MITITQTAKALTVNRTSSFLANGGTGPYLFEVEAGGAGGSITLEGLYTAPAAVNPDPSKAFDVVRVTDSLGDTATSKILVADTLSIFCEVLQRELNLPDGRVYLFNEKIMKPTDSGVYIAVSVLSDRPFGNNRRFIHSGTPGSEQYITVVSRIGVDVMSRSHEARDRRFEVLMALASDYSIKQQEANGFQISRLPLSAQIANLSAIDGAAIPFRFHFDVNITHSVSKSAPVSYYSTFNDPLYVINS